MWVLLLQTSSNNCVCDSIVKFIESTYISIFTLVYNLRESKTINILQFFKFYQCYRQKP